jgi:hypothetical protein
MDTPTLQRYLLAQLAVSIQNYLAIDIVIRNNIELIEGVDRASTSTTNCSRRFARLDADAYRPHMPASLPRGTDHHLGGSRIQGDEIDLDDPAVDIVTMHALTTGSSTPVRL